MRVVFSSTGSIDYIACEDAGCNNERACLNLSAVMVELVEVMMVEVRLQRYKGRLPQDLINDHAASAPAIKRPPLVLTCICPANARHAPMHNHTCVESDCT